MFGFALAGAGAACQSDFLKEKRLVQNSLHTLENAGWRDLGDLRNLEVVCFQEDAWSLWDLISILTLPGIIRIKAVVDDRLAGFVAGDPHPDENTGWITTIGVLPVFQRQGIGRELLERCEAAMEQRFVRLCVRRSNLPALAMYEQTGYTQVTTWQKYYRSGEDALVLEKDRTRVGKSLKEI